MRFTAWGARRRLFTSALVVLALVAAACGGSDKDTTETGGDSSTTTSIAADGSGGDGGATETTVEGDGSTAAGGGTSGGTTSGGSTGGGATGSGGGSTGSGGGSTGSGGGGATALQPAAAGTYTYDVEGTQKFGAQESPADTPSTLKVDAPQGSRQHSTESTSRATTEMTLDYRADGVYLIEYTTKQSGVNKTWTFDPPVLAAPANPTAGQKWSWPKTTSTDGKTILEATFTAIGPEQVTIGGEKVDTWKGSQSVTTSGDVNSKTTGERWISVAHRLIVKETSHIEGSFGAITFSGTQTKVMRSVKPA